MAEDIQENLKTYKLQLQQVEASLTTDAENEDLLKLKKDLQEVIDLTTELIVGKLTAAADGDEGHHDGVGEGEAIVSEHSWSVGDKCSALYSQDGMYYEALIDEILDDGTCTITFDDYGNTDVTQISSLKPADPSQSLDRQADNKPKSKKDLAVQQREYKRKKAQKKALRMKMLEEEREQEKSKWQSFNAKTFSKTNKGRVKKSIFATPDGDKGKVGVGTCGVGGKPMTAYQHQEKWKK
ncbi:survival of motor neuron-related-splicing factor 30-like [Haliotis asinina]|uniref:survival of motor neuron-related-splicing factor 30-like n=1 Tax=Haliotis asinina TaxID=109174 RepID=UPI0035322FCD